MQAIILKCPKFGRFHFGLMGLDENSSLYQTSDIIHSDTLFSALVSICAKTSPDDVEDLIASFKSPKDGMKISSAFYCLQLLQNEKELKKIFFLPKPTYLDLVNEDVLERKKVKNVRFISKTVWEKGLLPQEWTLRNGCYIIRGGFVLHTEDLAYDLALRIETISEIKTAPKIADHARQKRDNIFFQTDLLLGYTGLDQEELIELGYPEAYRLEIQPHFYFLLESNLFGERQRLEKLLILLLEVLVDEGIGGAISTGCGQLVGYEILPFSFDLEEDEGETVYCTSLSLIAPQDESDLRGVRRGKVQVRGGRNTASDGRLKRIKMFTEGTVIEKQVTGSIASLHPSKPYLRYGRSFPISMHSKYVLHDYL